MTPKEQKPQSNPGSDEAIEQGCVCPVLDNRHGAGIGGGQYWIAGNCPIHGTSTPQSNKEHKT